MPDAIPEYSPDADVENADWTKFGWDFPPYGSADFLDAIGGEENLPEFCRSPAYAAAVARGIIHDDEWVLDWCEPVGDDGDGDDDGPRRRPVHVHLHRGR
jgi:hypothetical protein